MPLIVSVMGFSRDELAHARRPRSGERDEVAALELNVSCPNVETGLVMGADPAETALARRARAPADRQAADREAHAQRDRPGRRGRAPPRRPAPTPSRSINTLKGMALHPRDRRAVARAAAPAGVSGPAVRAIALAQVRAVASRVRIPVIGMGGIASGRHAADFLAAGATCVAVGTESFRDPAAGRRIAAELAELSRSGGGHHHLDGS